MDPLVARIVRSYDDPIVRLYCLLRFGILRRFLMEIGQYLPTSGTVLDIGCGFGLFSLYFATRIPGVEIQGFDTNPRRVQMARLAAERLGLRNVRFEVADAAAFHFEQPVAAAYMLDLIHHIPEPSVSGLLRTLTNNLRPDGRLVIKDIEPTPAYKLAFTWLLDKLMDFKAPVHYWAPADVHALLESLGFDVKQHALRDYLPYPHVLYIGARQR